MTKRNAILIIVLIVLATLSIGCEGIEDASAETLAENVDKLSVEHVVEWQQASRDAGVECEFTWISTDLSVRLAHWHICTPATEKDEGTLADKLYDAITECVEICVNGYVEGSEGREGCRKQCLGPLAE